jgi:protein subunit release factor A
MPRELLFSVTKADLKIDTFKAGGKGGQNQNKRETGVRITHPPSGAVGEARDSRSQELNKKMAFRRMVNSSVFQKWLKIESARRMGAIANVDDLLREEHLKIEYGPLTGMR